MYHSTLGLRVIQNKKKDGNLPIVPHSEGGEEAVNINLTRDVNL